MGFFLQQSLGSRHQKNAEKSPMYPLFLRCVKYWSSKHMKFHPKSCRKTINGLLNPQHFIYTEEQSSVQHLVRDGEIRKLHFLQVTSTSGVSLCSSWPVKSFNTLFIIYLCIIFICILYLLLFTYYAIGQIKQPASCNFQRPNNISLPLTPQKSLLQ